MINPKIKVSVIITAYNSAEFIKRSVSSVLNQSFRDFELIVVDDGSTDNTVSILRDYKSSIKLITQNNSGPSAARNAGINASNSDLICFLDADDFWHKDKLMVQYNKSVELSNINIFCCNLMNIKNGMNIKERFDETKIFTNKNHSNEGIVENYIRPKGRYSFHAPSAIMVRKNIFDKYGLFDKDLKSVEDSEIVLRWGIFGEKIYYQNQVYVYYEIGNQDSLTKNVIRWSNNHFSYWIKNKYIKNIPENKINDFIIMRRLTLISCIKSVILNGQPFHALKLLIKNFRSLFSINYLLLYLYLPIPFVFLKKIKKYFISNF